MLSAHAISHSLDASYPAVSDARYRQVCRIVSIARSRFDYCNSLLVVIVVIVAEILGDEGADLEGTSGGNGVALPPG